MYAFSAEPVAGIRVVPLCDAIGPMHESMRQPLLETFPGSTPEMWERIRAEQPEAFGPDGEWVLRFYCFVLDVPGGPTVLVDTGLGDRHSPAASWAPVPGRLEEALSSTELSPADIDVVVLTHLHSDHASGAVVKGEPAFPNARYMVQQRELDWIAASPGNPVGEQTIRPLREAGCLDAVEGRSRLTPDVEIFPTPGHTPGHQSVVIDDHRLVVAGDVVLHPIHLADHTVQYVHDEDPATAAVTRAALLDRIRERDGLIAAPHLPVPFARP
ncbi:MBL fold metallo-hydrolase [Thermomonospora cellulosilytica]|uniref:Glyoxylase-like metal-dependent hydrolase (Beta-lactamase superfamily II) n=1 Tax=Thermomonospora cellulosilytica TaxID=1411118 RepID=A0A7W3MYL3_9ACTN|nr:MBL fold metallo-hydrolase [Thermomonospora cellulosilytica]MBA9004287.1 glyoxylase-like metal-dependent hydrolase (beta-lactamase superfamily II) [Thermomonospora cellulosilytica]